MLSTEVGRRVVSRILRHCRVDESILYGTNGELAAVVTNGAVRDVGLWLKSEAKAASFQNFQLMEFEARKRRDVEEKRNG